MEIMILDHNDDINILDNIGDEYMAFHNADEFGLVVNKDRCKALVHSLAGGSLSCALVLMHQGQAIGFAAGQSIIAHYGTQSIFHECFLFVSEKFRKYAKRLAIGLERWAKHAGCTHIILNASKAANAQSERVGKLYEHWGYMPYDASFIKVL